VSTPFLGRGWSFPPSFEHSHKGVNMIQDEEDVKSSLEILLATARGERVMLPHYGCNLESQLFEPLNTRQKTLLKDLIETAILYHEPRVELEELEIDDEQELEGVLRIELGYRIKATNSRFNVVFPYYLNEGTDVNATASVKSLERGG
jgi:phage baseplate assembly protein W